MGELNYTPGPWHITTQLNHGTILGNEIPRAEVASLPLRNKTQKANAQLMAAAPEMLDALKAIHKLLDDGLLCRSVANDHEDGWAMKQLPLVQGLAKMAAAIAKAEGRD